MVGQDKKSDKIASESGMVATFMAGLAGFLPGFPCPTLGCNSLSCKLHLPGSLAAWFPAGFSLRGVSVNKDKSEGWRKGKAEMSPSVSL